MQELRLKIGGMTCVNCSNAIERICKKIDGVQEVSVSYANCSGVFLVNDLNKKEQICKKISSLGFNVLKDEQDLKAYKISYIKKLKQNLVISAILSLIVMFFEMFIFDFYSKITQLFLSCFVIFYCGKDFFLHFFKSLNKVLDMNALVSLGAFFSFVYSFWFGIIKDDNNLYFSGGAMIITFILLGKFIEENIKLKSNSYEESMQNNNIKKVDIIDQNENIKEIPSSFVKKDDVFLVKEGESVCADGIIIKGKAEVDISFLNGEFLPILKKENDDIKAGSIVLNGILYIKASKKSLDSTIEELKNIIFQTDKFKININKIIDIVSYYFVIGVVLISIFTFAYYFYFYDLNLAFLHSLSVLLISCPCALGLAIPIALMNAFSNAFKKSILIKNPNSLEILPKIKYVIFDKTGTLSNDYISIYKHNLSNEDFEKLSSIQILSSHFLSKAFKSKNKASGNLKSFSGKGLLYEENKDIYFIGNEEFLLQNNINTKNCEEFLNLYKNEAPILIYFAKNDKCLGVVCLKNEIKNNAKKIIDYFKKENKKVIILSGDNENSVKKVANELNINNFHHSLKPEDKLNFIKKLNDLCLFVGDGINDSIAIKAANVSMVMNNGSELSKQVGDFIIINNDLENVKYSYKLAKKTINIIKMNLFWAFFYNVICIFIAMGAISFIKLTPHLAALIMCFSSICVVLNSLRIKNIN